MQDRIFHYTSVDTLEKILRSKTIRFNRLDCVDDVQECSVSNYAKYVFVSCWTESGDENIPLWKMYTNDVTQGVRISLPKDMFKKYPVSPDKHLKSLISINITPEAELNQADYYVLPVDFVNDDKYENFFRHVEYVRNPQIAVGKIESESHTGFKILAINRLGRYKSKCWEFQNEVRFVLNILPFNPLKISYMTDAQEQMQRAFSEMKVLPFKDYFLHLNEDVFDDMVVTLSPNISEVSREKVNLLIREYAPNTKVMDSCFLGKVNLK